MQDSILKNNDLTINEDDWWNEVNAGDERPKEGDTTKMIVGLLKDEKPIKKYLHIQVYNMGYSFKKPYELNFYIM